jgi:RHS repeat-associated protein
MTPVPGRNAVAKATPVDRTSAVTAPPAVVWPADGTADLVLSGGSGHDAGTGGLVWATGLPVGVGLTAPPGGSASPGAAATVRVGMLDRGSALRAGRDVVMRVGRPGATTVGPVTVALRYSGFRDAYGGDWYRRLRLVSLPECALRSPADAACTATPLPTGNDTVHNVLSAQVPASGGLVALDAAGSSDGGDYTVTDLKPTGTWSAGGNSGDFVWSYPLRVPPSLGGPAPKVQFAYSAQAVDGQTAATNTQPSWIGEGFAWQPGAIERGYRACTDDGQTNVGDLCWAGDNATLTLNGRTSVLVRDADSRFWRLKAEDGSTVEHLTNSGLGNGDNDGEYWKVTATTGVQYFFGLHRLPGWQAGNPETNSVFYQPVFGNNAGEPCNSPSGFAASSCQQAYRWNLDYVVDPHGNSMSYFYAREMNRYARNRVDTDAVSYVRNGWLREIDYGTRQDADVDSVFAGTAPVRVLFDVSDRCITPGPTCVLTKANAANWPDVPVDRQCDDTNCAGRYSPTFFTAKKLSTVTTQVASGTRSWRRVEQWRLTHEFKDPGDGNQKILWLTRIGHCGTDDGTCLPPVTFTATQLSNRVDRAGTTNSIIRYRIRSVTNESGGAVTVTYSDPECTVGSVMPASPDTNTLRCFPMFWTPAGATAPKLEYFHRYVTVAVSEADLTGGGADQVTYFRYPGAPAWHRDENPLTVASRRTWNQWRGYETVRTVRGANGTTQSQADQTFFRGMDGDRVATGGSRTARVTDSDGGTWVDSDWFAGALREEVTYLGTSTTVVSKSTYDPYQFGPVASQTLGGITIEARVVDKAVTTTKTALDGGRGWRTSRTTRTFLPDRTGRVSQVDDEGDLATTADDRCTRTTYASDPTGRLLAFVSREETVAVKCATTPDRAVDVISDMRTWYDGAASYDTTVTKGCAVRVETLAHAGGTPVYTQTGRHTYDSHGRVLDSFDAMDRRTTTAYTPASGGPVTRTVLTDPKGWTTTRDLDPAWGLPVSTIDVNGQRTDATYDGLGRLTAVWQPGRAKASQSADQTFTYTVRNSGGPSAVVASRLNPAGTGYNTSYDLYDGWLRKRQTQVPAVGGGRLISEALYDSRGLAYKNRPPYFNPAAPSAALFEPSGDVAVTAQTVTTFDGAGRTTSVALQVAAVEKWRTSTSYGGDHTDVSVPAGATAFSTWTDARQQVTAIRQYHGNVAAGAFDTITRTYTPAGDLASLTDPAGNTWRYTYDQRRHRITDTSPDRGTVTYTYDDADQMTSMLDARGITVVYTHDELDRKTAEFLTATTGTKLAEWTYDTLARGQLTASTRFDGGGAYVSAVTGYTPRNQPTGTKVTIPDTAGALAGSYITSSTYNADGSLATTTMPAKTGVANFGGLADETLTFGYNDLGKPTTLSGLSTYVSATDYMQNGLLFSVNLTDTGSRNLLQYWGYEPGTNRLVEHQILGDFGANVVAADTFLSYDPAGNITSVADKVAQYGAGPDDTQCFRYDHLRRLTEAWTPSSGTCAPDPAGAALGGPAPYRNSYTYDVLGNRTAQDKHDGGPSQTYTYPPSGPAAVRPHALTSVTGAAGTSTYTYDAAGNTLTRNQAGKPGQTLTWDATGHLATLQENGTTAHYTYDADGNRLLAKEANGTTLTIGDTEYRMSATGVTGTRTYRHGDAGAVATRGVDGVSWQASDHQGTSLYAFRASDLSRSVRRQTPFGGARGATPAWPSTRGFVGGVNDPSALVHLGAREFDPTIGRFLSVDPVFAVKDWQSWQGYAYADNTPVTASDPSGLLCLEVCGGADDTYIKELARQQRNAPRRNPWMGSCGAQYSASNCESGGGGPKDVITRTVYPHGTTLIVHRDGTKSINGAVLPPGVKDAETLAQRIDNSLRPTSKHEYEEPGLLATMWMIMFYCTPKLCTASAVDKVRKDREKLADLIYNNNGSDGFCGGAGGTAGQLVGAAGGVIACIAHDSKGWGLMVTVAWGAGAGGGWFAGAGPMTSDGDLDQNKRFFSFVDVAAGEGIAVDVAYAYGNGVHTSTILVGPGGGSPASVSGGQSYTWVFRF